MTQAKYIGGFTLKWVIYPFLRDQSLLFKGTFSVWLCAMKNTLQSRGSSSTRGIQRNIRWGDNGNAMEDTATSCPAVVFVGYVNPSSYRYIWYIHHKPCSYLFSTQFGVSCSFLGTSGTFPNFLAGDGRRHGFLGVSGIFFLLGASWGDQRPFGHQHYHCQIWIPCQRTAFFAESVMISMLYLELPHNLMQENSLSQGLAPIFEGGFPSRVGMGDPSPIGEEKPAALKT